jgi:hypothetical protein
MKGIEIKDKERGYILRRLSPDTMHQLRCDKGWIRVE